MMNAAHNKEIVRRAFDAWRARTGSPFDLLAETAMWTIVGNSAASSAIRIRPSIGRSRAMMVVISRTTSTEGSQLVPSATALSFIAATLPMASNP